jgi:hypothetical protein
VARGVSLSSLDQGSEAFKSENELPPRKVALAAEYFGVQWESSYLVDPASSHMLVSKIKPCMSKYKQVCTVKLRMAH